jgi:hypothetical protein
MVCCSLWATVEAAMAELERTEGIPIDQQRFIHKGKQLQMRRTLRGSFMLLN